MLEQTIAALENRDKILYEGEWLSIIRRDGWYEFARYNTSNGGVYILAYRAHPERPILGRYEMTPAHLDEKPTLTTITGGVNEKVRPIDVAVQEMHEEAGYQVDRSNFTHLGQVYLAKGADFVGHLFAIDISNLSRGDAPGDGTRGEQGAFCDWVSVRRTVRCKDPVMSCLIVRAMLLGLLDWKHLID